MGVSKCLLLFLVLLPLISLTQDGAGQREDTILFVCEHGAAKSVIAAAYFNKIARERGLKYRAVSRGTAPDALLTPATEKGLSADGIDTSFLKPQLVTEEDMDAAAQIVTFACQLPGNARWQHEVTEWNDIPPVSASYHTARTEIVKRVEMLIEKLNKDSKGTK